MTRGGGLSTQRKLAFTAAAALLSGAIALGALELIGRLFDPLGVSYYPDTARYMDTLVLEEPIGYRNRPGLSGRFYGAEVTINADGMRDREIGRDPAPGELRVAVLGDSFPFGIGVAYEDSIPAVIERTLQESAPAGTTFRTMNFGVPSYNSLQERIQFETTVLPLHPRAVVVLFALNDIFPKMWVFEKRRGFVTNLAQRSYAISLLFATKRLLTARPPDGMSFLGSEHYREDDPRWIEIAESLGAIHDRCRSLGIPFAVFTYDELEPPPVAMIRALGERHGFPTANVVPWKDPRWRGLDPRAYANSRVDSHPNREGSRIYGRLFADEMRRLGIVPAAARP